MMRPLIAAMVLASACSTQGDSTSCVEDECDGAKSRAEVLDKIDGFGDPVAE